MHGLLNGINLREEDGDNFMSDYQTYIKYAKKTINELEQLADLKKTFKGKKLAEKIREVGLKWITKSAVDSVLHGLGESSNFSNLNPQQKKVAEKLVSMRDEALTYKSSAIQGVAEGKITLSTDPKWYGANVGDYQATGPVVNIPATELVGFEPDDKMNQPKSKANVEKILAGLKRGDKLPPLLVRKYKNGYQVLDGHHRFWAYKLSGVKNIPSQIVPDSDIEEISNQGVIDENAEMAQSDVTKLIDYSEKLQSMFSVDDNLEDWVKAKLNHACDYVATVRDYLKFYNEEKQNIDRLTEEVKNLEQKFNKEKLDTVVDGIQYALDVVGLEPSVGSFADGANVVISLLRSALEKETDEKKKHLLNAAISVVSIVPFGDLAKIIKLRVLRKPAVKLLRFIKNILKSENPSYTDTLLEKWSNTYKKSINCKNPKGFSQQAHCRAKKLRQVGKHTKSKPVKECYKEAVQELLKEQNSSMAMGALKQINNDAKELQSMLQPNTQLEDWVKSKLNLAGEYLDDVYHHLDHFGPQGRKLDEILKELDYQGGVGIHEFVVFFQKASKEEEEQMNDCLKTNNVSCVKSLIQKVTGMTMNKIDEGYYDDKEIERKRRQMRFSTIEQREKKYWFTPDGTYEDAGNSHEQWIKNNVPELTGANLVQTYDKAIQKGYIRAIHDISAGTGMLMLSNLKNYGFALEGSTVEGIPAVPPRVVDAIRRFVEEKSVLIVATGKGNILKQFTSIDESELNESFRKTLAALGLAGLTTLGAMKGDAASSEKLVKQKAVQTQTVKKDNSALRSGEVKLLGGKLSDYIANWEGKENEVYKDSAGLPTIGIGHYLTNSEQDKRLFKSLFGNSVNYNKVLNGTQKLENDQVEKLFNVDVKIKEKLAKTKISEFESFPQYIKNAIICGLYRGDLGPKTIGHINSGDWQKASTEYLNHSNARSGPDQIKRRMKTNALAFSHYGKQLDRNK